MEVEHDKHPDAQRPNTVLQLFRRLEHGNKRQYKQQSPQYQIPLLAKAERVEAVVAYLRCQPLRVDFQSRILCQLIGLYHAGNLVSLRPIIAFQRVLYLAQIPREDLGDKQGVFPRKGRQVVARRVPCMDGVVFLGEKVEQLAVEQLVQDVYFFVQLDDVLVETAAVGRHRVVSLFKALLEFVSAVVVKHFDVGTFVCRQVVEVCQLVAWQGDEGYAHPHIR
ncbi:hypothetical protein Barb7_01508 [Bacteroidales bacterium Barb7]|nr:hypothetical protein Barb7_01508 [Bacteroidales bacterium Barb7]